MKDYIAVVTVELHKFYPVLKPYRIADFMAFRFEFDPVHKILLARFEGLLTNESAEETTTPSVRIGGQPRPLREFGTCSAPSLHLCACGKNNVMFIYAHWPGS